MKLYLSSTLLTGFIGLMIVYTYGILVEEIEIFFGLIIFQSAIIFLTFGLKLLIDYIKNGG